MLNIIKSDLFRILRGKAIYITMAVIIIMVIISCIQLSPGSIGISTSEDPKVSEEEIAIQKELQETKELAERREIIKEHYSFELDKSIIGSNINLYYFFIVITVIVLTTDFSNKSIKNTLSSAISRRKYYFSKFVLILVLGTFLILLNNYSTYFINLMVNGEKFASNFGDFTKLTIMQLPILYGLMSILTCFAFVFRKTSSFNTIAIPFNTVIQLIAMGAINLLNINPEILYKYEAQYILQNLAKDPTNERIMLCVGLGIAYMIIFNVIGYFSFKKIEIE